MRSAQHAPQRLIRAARNQVPQRDIDSGNRLRHRAELPGVVGEQPRRRGEMRECFRRPVVAALGQQRSQHGLDQRRAVLDAESGGKRSPRLAPSARALIVGDPSQ